MSASELLLALQPLSSEERMQVLMFLTGELGTPMDDLGCLFGLSMNYGLWDNFWLAIRVKTFLHHPDLVGFGGVESALANFHPEWDDIEFHTCYPYY